MPHPVRYDRAPASVRASTRRRQPGRDVDEVQQHADPELAEQLGMRAVARKREARPTCVVTPGTNPSTPSSDEQAARRDRDWATVEPWPQSDRRTPDSGSKQCASAGFGPQRDPVAARQEHAERRPARRASSACRRRPRRRRRTRRRRTPRRSRPRQAARRARARAPRAASRARPRHGRSPLAAAAPTPRRARPPRSRRAPSQRFIAGEPMKPATNVFTGRSYIARGVSHCCR